MTSAEKFLEELGNVDDEFIEEAMNYTMKKKFNFKPIIAVAACAAFIIAAVPVAKHFAGTLPGHMGGTTATTEAKLGASGKYTVLYAIGSDGSSLDSEQAIETDFDGLSTDFTDPTKVGTTKTIEIAGKTWTGTYLRSADSDYYMDDSDEYFGNDGEATINFSINRETGVCRRFFIGGEKVIGEELTRDECYTKALEHLKTYVDDIEKYEFVGEEKRVSGFGYSFDWNRVINGFKTADCVSVAVREDGVVYAHVFQSIGSMKDVDASGIDTQKMNAAVADKVKAIYAKYPDIQHNNKDIILTKLANGEYIFEYRISVENKDKNFRDFIKFIVETD